jgi:hypothetical protein
MPTGDPVIGDVLSPTAQGAVTPYALLADAYQKKHARFASDATGMQLDGQWRGAVSALYDELLARPMPGGSKFYNPRIRGLLLTTLDFARQRVASHGAAGDLGTWAQSSLYPDLEKALLGPVVAGAADALGPLHEVPAAQAGLSQLLKTLLADPGAGSPDAARFQSLLTVAADTMQLLLDDTDLVPLLKATGSLADPQTGALDGLLAVTRRALPADTQHTLITVGQNLFRSDSTGRYPMDYFGDIVNAINRPNSGDPAIRGTDLGLADQQTLLLTLGQFLADNQRGARRVVDIIRSRTGQ